MKQLIYLIYALTIIGCADNKQQAGTINLMNTIKSDSDPKNEFTKVEAVSNDYRILPIDESGSDPTLVAFLTNLRNIVSRKDTSGLFKSMDTAIVVSYGGGIYGIDEFSENWNLDKPNKSALWEILKQILSMGGTWENDEGKYFCIPYTQSNKTFGKFNYDFDWYFTAVCISSNVTVYKEPKKTSSKLATLSYNIVEMDHEFMKADFTKIHTIDKKVKGFVKSTDLFFSAAEHLIIKKIDDKWKITAFAPFD